MKSSVDDELFTVKLVPDIAVPLGVVTENLPLVAPAGTVAVICVELFMTKTGTGVVASRTDVAPVKFVPVMITGVATGPVVGLNPAIVGGGIVTVKLPLDVPVPPAVVTEKGPLVALAETVAVI